MYCTVCLLFVILMLARQLHQATTDVKTSASEAFAQFPHLNNTFTNFHFNIFALVLISLHNWSTIYSSTMLAQCSHEFQLILAVAVQQAVIPFTRSACFSVKFKP